MGPSPEAASASARLVLNIVNGAIFLGLFAQMCRLPGAILDPAVEIGHLFDESDLMEEPYLGFVVAHFETLDELTGTARHLSRLAPPDVTPV